MKSYFKEWVVVFPGKMGLSWKNANSIYLPPGDRYETFEQAEGQSEKNANTAVVPYEFFELYQEYEQRMVRAERELEEIKFGKDKNDYTGRRYT